MHPAQQGTKLWSTMAYMGVGHGTRHPCILLQKVQCDFCWTGSANSSQAAPAMPSALTAILLNH